MNKKIVIIFSILFLIGVLIGYYLIDKQSHKQTACTTEAKICSNGSSVGRVGPNCEFAACPEVNKDKVVDWNVYSNEKYGFEIKYPLSSNIKDDGYQSYLNGIRISFCGKEYSDCEGNGAGGHSQILFFKLEKSGAEKELYDFVFEGKELSSTGSYWPFGINPSKINCEIKSILIDGRSGKLWDCKDSLYAFWKKEDDDSFYLMDAAFLNEFPKLKDTVDQMLHTFKFL